MTGRKSAELRRLRNSNERSEGRGSLARLQKIKDLAGVANCLKLAPHESDRGVEIVCGCVDKRHSDSREFVLLGDARLHAGDIPPAIRRRLEAAYAADFAMFNFCVKR